MGVIYLHRFFIERVAKKLKAIMLQKKNSTLASFWD